MPKLTQKTDHDMWLWGSLLGLIGIGLVMLCSSSLPIAESRHLAFSYFFVHQIAYLAVGMVGLMITAYLPMKFWQKTSWFWLSISLLGLGFLLIPGVSREINGSVRWFFLGPISVQVSEFAKLALILYMASYLCRRHREVQTQLSGFLKPLLVLTTFTGLLLLEPDFGAAVVMAATVMGMLFLGGVPFIRFFSLFVLILMGLVALSIASPYRIERLTTFLNPWADQFNSGYQLTQALIAFGRGGWFGVGLGSSVQKLLYLPEAHTDFLFAVLAEELGLAGAFFTLLLYAIAVTRIFILGRRAILHRQVFGGYVAYGIGLWLGLQAFINVGVNVGILPTKGLTLPLMSWGGNSLVMSLLAMGLLLRIHFERKEIT